MKNSKLLPILFCVSLLSGCAGLTPGGNSTEGDSHVAGKTLDYSVKWVDEATLKVLDQMEIIVLGNDKTSNGQFIKAATLDLDILIELMPVTEFSTLMKIDITYSGDSKDNPTASEIIHQTQSHLFADRKGKEPDIAERLESIK